MSNCFKKSLLLSFIVFSHFGAAEVSEETLNAAKSVRLRSTEQVKNESLNAFFQKALKKDPWVYDGVWACFGNYFSTNAYTYTPNDDSSLEAIALKAAYGSRGITLSEYVSQLSPDGVKILSENRRKNSYLRRQLTGRRIEDENTSEKCKEARKSIKTMVSELDPKLKAAIGEESDEDFDMEVFQTLLIDQENKQIVVVSVGSADIPEPPIE